MLVAEVTTPVPSRSNDPSNHKREKLPMVLVLPGILAWGTRLIIINGNESS